MLTVGANAVTAAKSVSSYATVASDGTCQMTLTANIHLDTPVENLRFPLPEKAGSITVNGGRAKSRVENGLRQVDVSAIVGKVPGDFTLTFTYTLPNLVSTNEAGLLELRLPLLAGFAYPVQALEFSVTLPGEVGAKPAFTSGYHQANIEKDIYCTYTGNTITGFSQVELKDHETLSMTLLVSEQVFPQPHIVAPNLTVVGIVAAVLTVLSLVYWALALRCIPTWPHRQPMPPDERSAGELGSILYLRGADLNMTVFSWAQLGYLQICVNPRGGVSLQRLMDMGNERSALEQRCFKLLFGKRNTVDVSSVRYAKCYCAAEKMYPNLSAIVLPKSGNLRVFRGLAALAGVFCAIPLILSLTSGGVLQWFLVVVLGVLALVSGWCIQRWAAYVFAPQRQRLWIALALSAAWLLLGILAGQFTAAFFLVFGQLTAGLLAAMGGRRTPAGRSAMGQTLGLRRYLATVPRDMLQQISLSDPDYFHRMMPYALSLGADRAFARQFGKQIIGPCPYITLPTATPMRALQWRDLMRSILKSMNTKPKGSLADRILNVIRSLIK